MNILEIAKVQFNKSTENKGKSSNRDEDYRYRKRLDHRRPSKVKDNG